MALPLLAVGKTVHAGAGHARARSNGVSKDASFGSTLRRKVGRAASDGTDLLSQLAGMLAAGTPLATIVDRIARTVSNALANASGNDGNSTRRRTLERALAAALAPPGASPPKQSGLQQAASLERRLKDVLSRISGELKNAGQQNRFPGAVLDASSAREIPAQQQTKATTGIKPDASLAFADSLQRGTDILGRMLARAATADAQRTGQSAAAAAPAPNAHAASGSASPSDLFARLMNVIAQTSKESSAGDGGKQNAQFSFEKNGAALPHHSPEPDTGAQTPAFGTALTAASAPAPQIQATPAAPYTIDPQSIIEQVVKGIAVRNFGTTSEVRMRLQPEHLGDVSLRLTVNGNTISANIVAQNADVRNLLMQHQQQLARSLSEAGLSLGNFSVDVSGGNPGFSQQQTPQHHTLSKAGMLHLDAAGEDDVWADSRFGPPLLSGAKPLVLNYLA